jgi:hypothetical protein
MALAAGKAVALTVALRLFPIHAVAALAGAAFCRCG